ncbi:MAG: ATP phosphoribosyltransferase, partial [Desulfovibrio sp.]|nr:ATP phosphoribosyltransferase [Desulfovibrio sp.]
MSGQTLKLAIPKGSLEEATLALFARSGWKISMQHRNYFPTVNDPELSVSLCRPQEMGMYVGEGILDAGLTGKDWAMES